MGGKGGVKRPRPDAEGTPSQHVSGREWNRERRSRSLTQPDGTKLARAEVRENYLARRARVASQRAEILLAETAGYLEAEGMEATYRFSQKDIKKAVDINAAKNVFDLDLPTYGPYRLNFLRNGRCVGANHASRAREGARVRVCARAPRSGSPTLASIRRRVPRRVFGLLPRTTPLCLHFICRFCSRVLFSCLFTFSL